MIHFGGDFMTGSRIRNVEDICQGPIIRTSVLRCAGLCGKDINQLIQRGLLQRLRRGYYISPAKLDEMNTREILTVLVPDAVISLFSAAQYHDLTTVIPQKLEITLPVQKRVPVLPANLHIKVYKAVPHIYLVGIQIIQQDGYEMKIYDRERTVCDFFRMRLQIGKDCAFEVLKNYMAGRKNLQKLSEYAEALQIKGVLFPYLEVLVA
jgi:predicted transcriptional regulator of viral defense system